MGDVALARKQQSVYDCLKVKATVVLNVTRSFGGVQHSSEVEEYGRVLQRTIKRVVDDPKIHEEMEALVKRAQYLCRRACANTAFGWVTDHETAVNLLREFEELQEAGELLNQRAASRRSARRVKVGIVLAYLESESSLTELARTICERLAAVRHELVKWPFRAARLRSAMIAAGQLELLAADGTGRIMVKGALMSAGLAGQVLAQAVHEKLAKAAVEAQLGIIDNTINFFSQAL